MIQPTNSNILSPKPPPNSFIVGSWDDPKSFYAAIPTKKDYLAIVHQASVIKICRTEQSARNYIDRHSKKKSVAKLPIWFIMYFHDIMRSLNNMKQAWRDNNFVFTKEEQERYNELLELRRARVSQFYEEGRVAKPGASTTTAKADPAEVEDAVASWTNRPPFAP